MSLSIFAFGMFAAISGVPHAPYTHTQYIPVNNLELYQLASAKDDPLGEIALASVIGTLLEGYNIGLQMVNLAILVKTVSFKVKYMLSMYAKAKSAGGQQVKSLMEKWSRSSYQMKISCDCNANKHCKRKHKSELQKKKQKIKNLERELSSVNAENQNLRLSVERVTRQLAGKWGKRGRARQKRTYSQVHKRRQKRERALKVKDMLMFLNNEGLQPLTLTVYDPSLGSTVDITLHSEEVVDTTTYNCDVDHGVYVKDKFNISDRAYHELTQTYSTLPSSYVVKRRLSELNKQFNIQVITKGKYTAVYQSITERIVFYLNNMSDASLKEVSKDGKVCIKLSADGTKMGKHIHVVNFVFCIIGEESCSGEGGSHLVSIAKIPEKYSVIKETLKPLIEEVQNLKTVIVKGKSVDIVLFLGGDLKFLNIVMGIDACSCKFSCLWCKCPSTDRWDTDKEWSMIDAKKGARSVSEIEQMSNLKQRTAKFNCSFPPLFMSIPVHRVVPDTLHLFIRIADQLVNHLVCELRLADNLPKSLSSFSVTQYSNISKFQEFIHQMGINDWYFYVDKGTKQICTRDFTGVEHLKIFQNIDIEDMIPHHPKCKCIKEIWSEFLSLIVELKGFPVHCNDADIQRFQVRAKQWQNKFNEVYMTKHVTPYMHILTSHVPESLQLYGNLENYCQQGLEKLNERVTSWFFRASDHTGLSALTQVMLKQNRLDLLKAKCERELRFDIKCSTCKAVGHNKRTCLNSNRSGKEE